VRCAVNKLGGEVGEANLTRALKWHISEPPIL
jgi:hypothetical protein